MNQTTTTMRVGDHPVEDAFAPLHSPKQEIRTRAVLDRHAAAGNVELRSGEVQDWNTPTPERMMNTGKLRRALAPQRVSGLRIYIAGPMSFIPYFNFPAFDAAEKLLRSHGHDVFNPAEADRRRHGKDISLNNPTGDPEQAKREHGFSLREALLDDTHYICTTATAIAMLPGWERSYGADAEHRLAVALRHQVLYLGGFYA